MKKSILVSSALALVMAGGVAIAQPGPDGLGMGPMGADANKDGVLTEGEVRAQADKMFARMDVNKDGKLDKADREARKAERFARMDTDGNGEISQAEMKAARDARQAKMDERRAMMKERRADRFAQLDTDKSGGLSKAEMAAARDGMRQGADRTDGKKGGWHGRKGHGGGEMAMLKRADTNGDNAITKAEFEAVSMKMFTMSDTNKDGKVTAAERKAAHDAMKQRWQERRGDKTPNQG